MTDERLTVTVEELRAVFDVLMGHMEQAYGRALPLKHDLFWSLPLDGMTDVYQEPAGLTVGEISESLVNLETLLGDSSRVTSYGLVWLADVLRLLAADNPV